MPRHLNGSTLDGYLARSLDPLGAEHPAAQDQERGCQRRAEQRRTELETAVPERGVDEAAEREVQRKRADPQTRKALRASHWELGRHLQRGRGSCSGALRAGGGWHPRLRRSPVVGRPNRACGGRSELGYWRADRPPKANPDPNWRPGKLPAWQRRVRQSSPDQDRCCRRQPPRLCPPKPRCSPSPKSIPQDRQPCHPARD